ncbi:protein NRT1/ PTR FAMILY 1.1-like [Malania oleifera]|uniref:protein NRT1/ PTR FAMILY 1.1-like n=1 Tax=Malania oleifera TaxID=397392 RepID=UPI0025AE57E7|nr:protein NRT1/ PTR FAMILY 1.1-like [Malania oleifera]
MEGSLEQKTEVEKQQQQQQQLSAGPRKGGYRTMPFIIVNESFEKIAGYGIMPNMIFYLMKGYHMQAADGATILFVWSAISNSFALLGAFLSDSYLGRFPVIALGSFSSILGLTLLWLTAMIPQLKPPPCAQSSNGCTSAPASPAQLATLLFSFGFLSIGAGCIRPCSIAFGADQLSNEDNPNNDGLIQSFFNWYYASVGTSTILAFTVVVYIQDHLGWKVGFGVPASLMVLSTLMFLLGSPLYVKVKAEKSLFTGFIQVVVATFKRRNLPFPSQNFLDYHNGRDLKRIAPTKKLRFLNKACTIRDHKKDLKADGSASNPWNLCTINQVESLKALLRVLPMWSTGIIILVSLNQTSFFVLQASVMDRHITPKFKIPAGSFSVFTVLSLTIWLIIYDRALVPVLAKFTGRPRGLSTKVRMGIGLLLATAAIAISAVQEHIRRKAAIDQGLVEKPKAIMNMSAMWLVPQFCLFGLAEAFNAIGQIDFYYSQFPRSMSSIAVALFTLGMAVSNLVGSLLVKIVDRITRNGGKESWMSSNLNKGHLDYYYWLITALSVVNFGYFLVCCWAYGPTEEEKSQCGTGWSKGGYLLRFCRIAGVPPRKMVGASTATRARR